MTAAFRRTSGNTGHAPAAILTTSGNQTVVYLPADSTLCPMR